MNYFETSAGSNAMECIVEILGKIAMELHKSNELKEEELELMKKGIIKGA